MRSLEAERSWSARSHRLPAEGRAGGAVGDDGEGVAVSAQAGLDEAAGVVDHTTLLAITGAPPRHFLKGRLCILWSGPDRSLCWPD